VRSPHTNTQNQFIVLGYKGLYYWENYGFCLLLQ